MSATKLFRGGALLVGALVLVFGGATVATRLTRGRAPASLALAGFTERDVRVEIALERAGGSAGESSLRARFTPTRPGFRLYAKDLPRDGLEGIGRPTLLEIVSAPGLKPIGPLRADRAPGEIRSDVLGLTFPVYPPGPVTLDLPVRLTGERPTTAELSVTYMTCSERTCMPPAIDRRVTVNVPAAH